MSNAKSAVSFDEIIQADRQRRKNEELANEIFGRSRKAKDNSRDLDRKQSRTPSLASRVGVAKRSNSSTNVKPSSFNPPSRPSSATANIARTNRLATAVNNRQQTNVSTTPIPRGPGLSIKGAAGRFTLEASNFAPGTTVPDIEAALKAVVTETNTPIEILSCRFTSTTPVIVAEIIFPEKPMADAVIKTFNGLLADGRILQIHHKTTNSSRPAEPTFISDPNPTPAKDLFDPPDPAVSLAEEPTEDVEMEMATEHEPAAYTSERDRSDRERRDRDRDRDREPRHEDDDDRNGGRRDERERERDRDRDGRDRNRDNDHNRDRDHNSNSRRYDDRPRYDRRDDGRGGSSRGYGPPGGGFDQRGGGGRPYGNNNGMGFPRDGVYNDGNGMMGSPRGGGFRGGGGYRGFGRGRGF